MLNPHCTLKHTVWLYCTAGTYIRSLEFAQDQQGNIVGLWGKTSNGDNVRNIFSEGSVVSAMPFREEQLGYVARLQQWIDAMDAHSQTTKSTFYCQHENIGILGIEQGADGNLVGVTGISVMDRNDNPEDFKYYQGWVHALDLAEGHGLDSQGNVPEGFVGRLAKWDIKMGENGVLGKYPFSQLIMGAYYFVPDKRPAPHW